MAAKGKRFSFTRLITNAIPNFALDSKDDVDLSPQQADLLLIYQLSLPHPRYLGPEAFYHAGIVGHKSLSKTTQSKLIKHGLILPTPAKDDVGADLMTVNTAGITKNFANQFSHISVHAQRKLIGMLFFWEEECVRWKLLDQEEVEIRGLLEEAEEGSGMGRNADLQVALRAVEMKRSLKPSDRGVKTVGIEGGQVRKEELPSYGSHVE